MAKQVRLVLRSLTEQVYEHLQASIADGTYLPGSMIPSERELQDTYGVSRATIREAVSQLVAAGLLRRQQGRGTFVQTPPVDEEIATVTSFAEEVRSQGKVPTSRILSCASKPAPPHVRQRLVLSHDQLVTIMERLRFVDGEPVSLCRDYVPTHLAPSLSAASLVEESLYRGLEEHFGIRLTNAEEEVEAIIPTPAESRLLGMKPGSPVLYLRRTTFGATSDAPDKVLPVHYTENEYRADRFRYVAKREGRRRNGPEAGNRRKGGGG